MKCIIYFFLFSILALSVLTSVTNDCITLYNYFENNIDNDICINATKSSCDICEKQKSTGSRIEYLTDTEIVQLVGSGYIDFKNFPKLETYNLVLEGLKYKSTSKDDIPTLTKNFFEMESVHVLEINNATLERISNFTKNESIYYLGLNNNNFKEFPKELLLSEIELLILKLENNQMSGELKFKESLQSFSGNNNHFNSIFCDNNNSNYRLQELKLSNNDFDDETFNNVTCYKDLYTLDMSGNKKITKIPSSIKQLSLLENISFSNTSITTISKYIYNLKFLKSLDISNNPQLKTKIIKFNQPIECNFENTNILCYEQGSCENIDPNKYKPCTEEEIKEIRNISVNEYMDYRDKKSNFIIIIIIIIFISLVLLIIGFNIAHNYYKKMKFEKTKNKIIESKINEKNERNENIIKEQTNNNQNLGNKKDNEFLETDNISNLLSISLGERIPMDEPFIPMAEPIYETCDNKNSDSMNNDHKNLKEKNKFKEKFIVNSPSIPTAELVVQNNDNTNTQYPKNNNFDINYNYNLNIIRNLIINNDELPAYSDLAENDEIQSLHDSKSIDSLIDTDNNTNNNTNDNTNGNTNDNNNDNTNDNTNAIDNTNTNDNDNDSNNDNDNNNNNNSNR